jgi:hypothetical protein
MITPTIAQHLKNKYILYLFGCCQSIQILRSPPVQDDVDNEIRYQLVKASSGVTKITIAPDGMSVRPMKLCNSRG